MFIVETQKAVKSSKQTETELPPHIKPLYDYIEKIQNMLDECPPIDQPMRFGNKAFKNWLDKIISNVDSDLSIIAAGGNPDFKNFDKAIPEIREYLIESFGSYERIDYGTGHELNFFIFLYCMCKIGIYSVNDFKPLINVVFQRYLVLMRKIQTYYFLEPAGSHGVWGLDDY